MNCSNTRSVANAGGRLRIAAMGDVMLARDVGEHFEQVPGDFAMKEIGDLLAPADLVLANLENPVSEIGIPHQIQHPHVTFCAKPQTLAVLKNIGVDAVSLGNNHMLDYGGEALAATLRNLDELEIGHVGAGRCYTEANRPLEIDCGGHRVAVLSHSFVYSASTLRAGKNSPGVSDHRIKKILRRIRTSRKNGQTVIVSLHWGIEYCFYPVPYQMDYARQMIDAGAHLVVGHGPHYPQGVETYRNGLILYSLGNFVFDEPFRFANQSYIAMVDLDPKGGVAGFDLHPFDLKSHVPQLTQGEQKKRQIALIDRLTALYREKDTEFWRHINRRFLGDILWRVRSMKSTKFLFLHPMAFYLDLGLRPMLRKAKRKALAKLGRLCGAGV
jgi:poly-gamma-glutamate synthesis protein (capsule biosynthesis protein)